MSNINRTMTEMAKERRRAEEALQASERVQAEMKRTALDNLYAQRGPSTVQVRTHLLMFPRQAHQKLQ